MNRISLKEKFEKQMLAVVIIGTITCICLVLSVLLKPSIEIKEKNISIYWMIVLVGALVILFSGLVSFKSTFKMMTSDSSINPIKILVLFLSMSVMSIFLDEIGFFKYLACIALKKAKRSQMVLFIYLYAVVSVLTVFTSNDIIILTFTPFICYFSKNAKIDPIPYLFAEFVAANTWSMMFVIGNPTNIYLATANGISFVDYVCVMCLPTVLGGLTAFGMLLLVFGKRLKKPLESEAEEIRITDNGMLIIGMCHLIICTILLVISSYINVDMWLVTLCFAVSLFLWVGVYQLVTKKKSAELLNCLKRMPWQLIPFVLSMFVLVMALDKYGITKIIADWFGNKGTAFVYGAASYLSANFVNNIPMSVLFCSIIDNAALPIQKTAAYAAIIGSNLGALFTPIGALAGIMWSSILVKNNVKFGFLSFVKYGFMISVPILAMTLFGLCITL